MSAEPVDVPRIAAVTVDLDDTLFPRAAWLAGAWEAVAAAGRELGLDAGALLDRLHALSAAEPEGSRLIDRALVAIGVDEPDLPAITPGLLAAYRGHAPASLACYPGVQAALLALRAAVPVACIADGDPHIQRCKLRSLGLVDAFDAVVWSDELGREFRKPHPAPFAKALRLLGVPAAHAVHVGDRPVNDVGGAAAAGMRGVRVRTGGYAGVADDAAGAPWLAFDDAAQALTALAVLARD